MSSIPVSSVSEKKLSTPEFVAMTAFLMALNALAIDVMLPAMQTIGHALNVENDNDAQQIIGTYMMGFGFSQLVWGPITDALGRKRLLMFILMGYVAFSLGCVLSGSFSMLLTWRFLLGVTAGGTRVIAISVVRDLFVGRGMAKIISLIMTVFMVIPILAPALGQAVLYVAPWQGTFALLVIGGLIMLVWAWLRLPETRPPEKCTKISPMSVLGAYWKVFTTPVAIGYTIASGVIFAALFAFLAASEQIFRDVFDKEKTFVLWFASVALAMSIANFANSRIVEKFGMRSLSHFALVGFTATGILMLVATHYAGESFVIFMTLFILNFFCFGFIGPNFNSMAMEPLGEIAGTASAILGFASTTMAAFIGGIIASHFDGTLISILDGYCWLGIAALAIAFITERGKLFSGHHDEDQADEF